MGTQKNCLNETVLLNTKSHVERKKTHIYGENLCLTGPMHPFLNQRKEKNISRNYFMIISTKVWDRVGIELATPGSAVRHVTDCAMWPCMPEE